MKTYTFIEVSPNQIFGRIIIQASTIKEAKNKLLDKITKESLIYSLLVLNKKTSELFTLI